MLENKTYNNDNNNLLPLHIHLTNNKINTHTYTLLTKRPSFLFAPLRKNLNILLEYSRSLISTYWKMRWVGWGWLTSKPASKQAAFPKKEVICKSLQRTNTLISLSIYSSLQPANAIIPPHLCSCTSMSSI